MIETSTLTILSFVGNFVLVLAMVFMNWKKGTSSASKEIIDLREKQISAEKDERRRLEDKMRDDRKIATEQVNSLTAKVGELTGLVTSKDHEIKRLSDQISFRSPEMESFFKQTNILMAENQQYIKDTSPMIVDIHKVMIEAFPKLLELMGKIDEHLSAK